MVVLPMRERYEFKIEPAAEQHQAPDWIRYSPELIGELKADHAELVRRYDEIESMALCGDYAPIPAELDGFKTRFESHIVNENLRFYCYLEERLAGNAPELGLVKACRTELNAIAFDVVSFIRKYRSWGVRPTNSDTFLAELRCVGALLAHRVDREEKDLYPLYRP